MPTFISGCKARCLDDRNAFGVLKRGNIYLVSEVKIITGDQMLFLAPHDPAMGWDAHRFELVTPGCDLGKKK